MISYNKVFLDREFSLFNAKCTLSRTVTIVGEEEVYSYFIKVNGRFTLPCTQEGDNIYLSTFEGTVFIKENPISYNIDTGQKFSNYLVTWFTGEDEAKKLSTL